MSAETHTLFETAAAPAAETSVYPSTARTIIDKCSGYGFAAGTLTIKLVPSGGSAGNSNIMEIKAFNVGESYTFPGIVGHTLEAGDFISVIASGANLVNLRISGRKVT